MAAKKAAKPKPRLRRRRYDPGVHLWQEVFVDSLKILMEQKSTSPVTFATNIADEARRLRAERFNDA